MILRRLWFDKRVCMRFPANVLSGFDDTMGSTFFNLCDLQVGCSSLTLIFLHKPMSTAVATRICSGSFSNTLKVLSSAVGFTYESFQVSQTSVKCS